MRVERAALPLALAMAGLPVVAQDCAGALSPLLTTLRVEPFGPIVDDGEGWCRMDDLRLGGMRAYSPIITADSLAFRLEGAFGRDGRDLTLPQAVDVAVTGLRIGVVTGDPVMDWLMEAQRGPAGIDGTLSIAADPVTGEVRLTGLDIDFPGENAVAMTASLTGLDAGSGDRLVMSLPQARLGQLDLTVTSNGLFETYALMPLGTALLSGAADPASLVEGAKTAAIAYLSGLPEDMLGPGGRDALVQVIGDMPNPAGTLRLTIDAPGGLGAERLAPVLIGGVQAALNNPGQLLDGVGVTLAYDRTTSGEGSAP